MDKEKLKNILEKASGNATDIYFTLYTEYFENGDNPVEALQIILEYPNPIGDQDDKNPTNITYRRECRIVDSIEDLITGISDRIAGMNLTKKEFYEKLYDTIFKSDNELFPRTKEEKVIALKILSEIVGVVPYYQIIDSGVISDKEFKSGIDRLWDSIQEAEHMLLYRQNLTLPEEAAQILRITDGISDRKDQIIFWMVIIHKLRHCNDQE